MIPDREATAAAPGAPLNPERYPTSQAMVQAAPDRFNHCGGGARPPRIGRANISIQPGRPETATCPVPNFAGRWNGLENTYSPDSRADAILLDTAETGMSVTVRFYEAVGAGLPPDAAGDGEDRGEPSRAEYGLRTFSADTWTLTLVSGNQLHFGHHMHYVNQPGRPDRDSRGDLVR